MFVVLTMATAMKFAIFTELFTELGTKTLKILVRASSLLKVGVFKSVTLLALLKFKIATLVNIIGKFGTLVAELFTEFLLAFGKFRRFKASSKHPILVNVTPMARRKLTFATL